MYFFQYYKLSHFIEINRIKNNTINIMFFLLNPENSFLQISVIFAKNADSFAKKKFLRKNKCAKFFKFTSDLIEKSKSLF